MPVEVIIAVPLFEKQLTMMLTAMGSNNELIIARIAGMYLQTSDVHLIHRFQSHILLLHVFILFGQILYTFWCFRIIAIDVLFLRLMRP